MSHAQAPPHRVVQQAHDDEESDLVVVGLREGAMLRVEGDSVELRGRAGARIFRPGQEPVEVVPVAEIQTLVE